MVTKGKENKNLRIAIQQVGWATQTRNTLSIFKNQIRPIASSFSFHEDIRSNIFVIAGAGRLYESDVALSKFLYRLINLLYEKFYDNLSETLISLVQENKSLGTGCKRSGDLPITQKQLDQLTEIDEIHSDLLAILGYRSSANVQQIYDIQLDSALAHLDIRIEYIHVTENHQYNKTFLASLDIPNDLHDRVSDLLNSYFDPDQFDDLIQTKTAFINETLATLMKP